MGCAPGNSKPSSKGPQGCRMGGVTQFELGFVSTLLFVCLLGRADLGTMPQVGRIRKRSQREGSSSGNH